MNHVADTVLSAIALLVVIALILIVFPLTVGG